MAHKCNVTEVCHGTLLCGIFMSLLFCMSVLFLSITGLKCVTNEIINHNICFFLRHGVTFAHGVYQKTFDKGKP